MAIVVDLFDLAKGVTGRVLLNPDLSKDNTSHNLMIIKDADLKRGTVSGTIILKNEVASCCFSFHLTSIYSLRVYIEFFGKILNSQYEVTLYYINYAHKFQFMETLNLSNVKLNSTYFSTHNNEIFYEMSQKDPNVYIPKKDKFINGHLCLYCKITEKCITPMKIQIPRNAMLLEFFSFYNDKQFTDFKIICQEEEFLVHKLVLAAVSPVFRAMFECQLEEPRKDGINIDNFPKMVPLIEEDEILEDSESGKECMELKILFQPEESRKVEVKIDDFQKVDLNQRDEIEKELPEEKLRQVEEHQKDEVIIDDFDPKTVEQMVLFIYTDKIEDDLPEEELLSLIRIADKYSLGRLKMLCIQEKAKYVQSVSQALEVLSFAESGNVFEFKEVVLQFIKDNKHTL